MSKKVRAVIIDDEENARMYLAKMLELSFPELEIEFAISPKEALFVLEKKMLDLIFLDVEMPGMTGLDMLNLLREKNVDTPVVIVSQYNKADFIKKAMRLDAVDYLDKPVDPDELEIAVRKIISKGNLSVLNENTDNRISLNTNKGTMFFSSAEIMCFETCKRASIIHTTNGNANLTAKESLINLEKMLPSDTFMRVSRQFIINVNFIKIVQRNKFLILQSANREIKIDKIFPWIFEKFSK